MAQPLTDENGSDLEEIKVLAFEKSNFAEAIRLAESQLVSHPENTEVHLFLCRLYFWSKNELSLSKVNEYVLKYPNDLNGHLLMVDIYENEGKFSKSLELIRSIEDQFSDDQNFQFRKAYCLSQLSSYQEAEDILTSILGTNPAHEKAMQLLKDIKPKASRNQIQASYQRYFLDGKAPSINFLGLSYARKFKTSVLLCNVNSAKTPDQNGLQFGLDIYKVLNTKSYIYLHGAYSNSKLFPSTRFSSAIFYEYPSGFKMSLFGSLLKFNEGSIKILSPSLGYQIEDFDFSGRAYFSFNDSRFNTSFQFVVKKYILSEHNYLGLGFGSIYNDRWSPNAQLATLMSNFIMLQAQLNLMESLFLNFSYNRNISKHSLERDLLSINVVHHF